MHLWCSRGRRPSHSSAPRPAARSPFLVFGAQKPSEDNDGLGLGHTQVGHTFGLQLAQGDLHCLLADEHALLRVQPREERQVGVHPLHPCRRTAAHPGGLPDNIRLKMSSTRYENNLKKSGHCIVSAINSTGLRIHSRNWKALLNLKIGHSQLSPR